MSSWFLGGGGGSGGGGGGGGKNSGGGGGGGGTNHSQGDASSSSSNVNNHSRDDLVDVVVHQVLPHLYPQTFTGTAESAVMSSSSSSSLVGGGGCHSIMSMTTTGSGGNRSRGGGLSFWGDSTKSGASATRFSTLLLEHGEESIQDWAVVAYAAPWKAGVAAAAAARQNNNNSNNNNNNSNANSDTTAHGSATVTWAQSPQVPPRRGVGGAMTFHNDSSAAAAARKRTIRNMSSSSSLTNGGGGVGAFNNNHPNIRSVTDITKDEYPTVYMTKIAGRLYLCSRSLVFEPHDASRGVIRCPWSRIADHGGGGGGAGGGFTTVEGDPHAIQIYTHRHIVMKVNNVLGPFETIAIPTKFRFCFLHSLPGPMMDLARRLYRATMRSLQSSSMMVGGTRQSASSAEAELQAFRQEHQQQNALFDMDNLVDVVREQLLLPPIPANILTPLQSQSGVLVVTTGERLYFQPGQVNVMGAPPLQRAVKWNWADIAATARRYHGLRDSALEIYWKSSISSSSSSSSRLSLTGTSRKRKETNNAINNNNNNMACSTLIAFERRHDREEVLRLLPLMAPCVTDRDFLISVVKEWLEGNISNYDYLLALNSAAGRSFHDLSRYPVFPWVLADYTSEEPPDLDNPKTFRDLSKPMGALNPERLEYFQQRLANMQDLEKDPFLYGTHYSAPAYVLYYLVRSMPEHMLCLQNGKFDAADRMFYSISHCYQCCLTNHADVKELIPQFFSLDKFDLDFLQNARALSLGATQTGERVHDVILPPWAKDSPRKFVQLNRQALESAYCTQNLPAWIDLIFGVSSRGEAAEKANNLFHRMSYLGPRELADASPEERATAELQATEFGIVPDQLFQKPHPLPFKYNLSQRSSFSLSDNNMEALLAPHVGRAPPSSTYGDGGREAWELLDPPSSINSSNNNKTFSQHGSSENEVSTRGDSSTAVSKIHSQGEASRKHADAGILHSAWSLETHGTASFGDTRSLPLRGTGEPPSSSLQVETTMNPFDSSEIYHHSSSNQQQQQLHLRNSTSPTTQQSAPRQPQALQTPSVVAGGPTVRTAWDMKMLERQQVHSDAVSGCVLLLANGPEPGPGGDVGSVEAGSGVKQESFLLATTSLDGGLKVLKISLNKPTPQEQDRNASNPFSSPFTRFSYSSILSGRGTQPAPSSTPTSSAAAGPVPSSKLTEFRTHSSRDPLASLVVASDGAAGYVAFAGGHDDVVLAYGINSACAVASVYSHRDAVTGLDLIPAGKHLTSALWLDNATHIMVSGSWDATVKVWSACVSPGETVAIHREPLAELFDADSSIVSVSACALMGDGGIVIAAGCADGSFCVWNIHNDGMQVIVHKEPQSRRGSGPCSEVQWVRMAGDMAGREQWHLFCSFSTGKVASYSLVDGASRLLSSAAVSVGVSVLSMVYSEGILLVGCSDGGLRLIPVSYRQGGPSHSLGFFFDTKPTLWKAVNSKQSPGICSISISYMDSGGGSKADKKRCICCTGAEDGSVALFELKLATTPPSTPTISAALSLTD